MSWVRRVTRSSACSTASNVAAHGVDRALHGAAVLRQTAHIGEEVGGPAAPVGGLAVPEVLRAAGGGDAHELSAHAVDGHGEGAVLNRMEHGGSSRLLMGPVYRRAGEIARGDPRPVGPAGSAGAHRLRGLHQATDRPRPGRAPHPGWRGCRSSCPGGRSWRTATGSSPWPCPWGSGPRRRGFCALCA